MFPDSLLKVFSALVVLIVCINNYAYAELIKPQLTIYTLGGYITSGQTVHINLAYNSSIAVGKVFSLTVTPLDLLNFNSYAKYCVSSKNVNILSLKSNDLGYYSLTSLVNQKQMSECTIKAITKPILPSPTPSPPTAFEVSISSPFSDIASFRSSIVYDGLVNIYLSNYPQEYAVASTNEKVVPFDSTKSSNFALLSTTVGDLSESKSGDVEVSGGQFEVTSVEELIPVNAFTYTRSNFRFEMSLSSMYFSGNFLAFKLFTYNDRFNDDSTSFTQHTTQSSPYFQTGAMYEFTNCKVFEAEANEGNGEMVDVATVHWTSKYNKGHTLVLEFMNNNYTQSSSLSCEIVVTNALFVPPIVAIEPILDFNHNAFLKLGDISHLPPQSIVSFNNHNSVPPSLILAVANAATTPLPKPLLVDPKTITMDVVGTQFFYQIPMKVFKGQCIHFGGFLPTSDDLAVMANSSEFIYNYNVESGAFTFLSKTEGPLKNPPFSTNPEPMTEYVRWKECRDVKEDAGRINGVFNTGLDVSNIFFPYDAHVQEREFYQELDNVPIATNPEGHISISSYTTSSSITRLKVLFSHIYFNSLKTLKFPTPYFMPYNQASISCMSEDNNINRDASSHGIAVLFESEDNFVTLAFLATHNKFINSLSCDIDVTLYPDSSTTPEDLNAAPYAFINGIRVTHGIAMSHDPIADPKPYVLPDVTHSVEDEISYTSTSTDNPINSLKKTITSVTKSEFSTLSNPTFSVNSVNIVQRAFEFKTSDYSVNVSEGSNDYVNSYAAYNVIIDTKGVPLRHCVADNGFVIALEPAPAPDRYTTIKMGDTGLDLSLSVQTINVTLTCILGVQTEKYFEKYNDDQEVSAFTLNNSNPTSDRASFPSNLPNLGLHEVSMKDMRGLQINLMSSIDLNTLVTTVPLSISTSTFIPATSATVGPLDPQTNLLFNVIDLNALTRGDVNIHDWTMNEYKIGSSILSLSNDEQINQVFLHSKSIHGLFSLFELGVLRIRSDSTRTGLINSSGENIDYEKPSFTYFSSGVLMTFDHSSVGNTFNDRYWFNITLHSYINLFDITATVYTSSNTYTFDMPHLKGYVSVLDVPPIQTSTHSHFSLSSLDPNMPVISPEDCSFNFKPDNADSPTIVWQSNVDSPGPNNNPNLCPLKSNLNGVISSVPMTDTGFVQYSRKDVFNFNEFPTKVMMGDYSYMTSPVRRLISGGIVHPSTIIDRTKTDEQFILQVEGKFYQSKSEIKIDVSQVPFEMYYCGNTKSTMTGYKKMDNTTNTYLITDLDQRENLDSYQEFDVTCVFSILPFAEGETRTYTGHISVELVSSNSQAYTIKTGSQYKPQPVFEAKENIKIETVATFTDTPPSGLSPKEIEDILKQYQDSVNDATGGVKGDDVSIGHIDTYPKDGGKYDTDVTIDIDTSVDDDFAFDLDWVTEANNKFVDSITKNPNHPNWGSVSVPPPSIVTVKKDCVGKCGGECRLCQIGDVCTKHEDCFVKNCNASGVCESVPTKPEDNSSKSHLILLSISIIFTSIMLLTL